MSTAAQTGKESKQLPAIRADKRGLKLESLDDMWRFANYVASSGLAPKGIDTPQAILVALQMGAELGLTPMSSLQNVAVINGRPSVWGDAMLAVCRSSGLFSEADFIEEVQGEGNKMVASCTVRRVGGQPITKHFGVSDAEKAGLWKKTGPWQQYPARMLQLRARGFALRDAFSDALKGFLSAEEARDLPRDAAPHSVAPEPSSQLAALTRTMAEFATDKVEETPTPEPVDEEPEDGLSEQEKAMIEVLEALDAATSLSQINKVLVANKTRFRDFGDLELEWLIGECDSRAQRLKDETSAKKELFEKGSPTPS